MAKRKKTGEGPPLFCNKYQNTLGLARYSETAKNAWSTSLCVSQNLSQLKKDSEKKGTPFDLKSAFETIKNSYKNVGSFFAWQILCDVMESGALGSTVDENFWCQLGPGGKQGIRCIFGSNSCRTEEDYLAKAEYLTKQQTKYLSPEFYYNQRPITLKNIEHTLCEYQKYVLGTYRVFQTKSHLDLEKPCDICGVVEDSVVEDSLMFCASCNLSCHLHCAGLKSSPSIFFCLNCESEK